MGENSKIEWTDHTFNPWYGCTKVSPGCDHCYAEPGQSALASFNGETIRAAARQKAIGKIPSNGMRKLVRLNGSTAVGRVCFVRLFPTCLIIRLRHSGAKTCSQ